MYSRQVRTNQNSSNSNHTATNRFAPPKFFVQPQAEESAQQQPSAAELEKISTSDSNWPDVSMFTNRPVRGPELRVQMKPQQGDGLTTMQRVKQYDAHIQEASKRYGIAVEMIRAIIAQESQGNPNADNGKAYGLMQVKKETWLGVTHQYKELQNYNFDTYWKDPHVNILVGTATLKSKIKSLSVKTDDPKFEEIASVAYNAGETTVKIAIKNATKNGSKNPTADYLKPENLKPVIESTGIYSYYLTGEGKKRNLSGSKEEAIDLKYKEINKYPLEVKGYLKEQKNPQSGNTTPYPIKEQKNPQSGNTAPHTRFYPSPYRKQY
ncbi:MAG TPA: transglycosylase SLT domain-containing protein [Nostocaceae cyanobacterium]|nr:transglycosylase SLT domain-containing protein [Nostocaceae cyanobacterium]